MSNGADDTLDMAAVWRQWKEAPTPELRDP